MALGPCHYLLNMLDHRYLGKVLSDAERSQAYDHLKSVNEDLVPFVMTLQCADSGDIFPKYMFMDTFLKVSPMTWWNIACQAVVTEDANVQTKLRQQMLSLCSQLFCASATTASLERIFSSYGLVHSKLRNKLGNKKAAQPTFLFRYLNQDKQGKITPTDLSEEIK